MSRPSPVPWLWSWFVRGAVFVVFEGACARLADRPMIPGRRPGAELLAGLLCACAALAWPGLAALGARAILAARERRFCFAHALARAIAAYAPALPYLMAPLFALALRAPPDAPWLALLAAAYLAIAGALACVLARGTAPWGEPVASRFLARAGSLYALALVVLARASEPEATLAAFFQPQMQLVFPWERGLKPAASHGPDLPAHPVPALELTHGTSLALAAMALAILVITALLWRTSPEEKGEVATRTAPQRPDPGDLWPTVIAFVGGLSVLLVDGALFHELDLGPRPRAFAIVGTETMLIALLALAVPRVRALCSGGAFRPALGALACLASATVLAQHELLVHHLPTTLAVLTSVLAFTAAAGAAARALPAVFDEGTAWAVWAGGGSAVATALVLTDTLFQKIALFESLRVWQIFTGCWLVTKATLIALILIVSAMLAAAE